MLVEIAVACHLFQRRLVWMLSSILQQVGDKPDIVVSISYVPNNGIPTTEDCIRFFREKGLNIIDVVMEPGQESIRVLARNIRAKETQADWMIWADADMVYHKEFFADLKNKVSQEPVLSCTQVMGADRHSLNIPFCVNYFNEDKREYPCIIDNVAELVSTWPDWRFGGKHIAAGYFQLANVQAIKNKGSVYSNRCGGDDILNRHCKSDRQFRIHMGGRVPIDLLAQYHLNHSRQPNVQQ